MRRNKQELDENECIEILKTQSRGFLAVIGDEEYPYTLPFNYVYEDEKIIFHTALDGHVIDSIKKNNKVSFCVLNDGEKRDNHFYYVFKSVIVFGKIGIITDEKDKYQKLTSLGNKYYPSEEYTQNVISKSIKRTLVLELSIEYMSGKIVTEK